MARTRAARGVPTARRGRRRAAVPLALAALAAPPARAQAGPPAATVDAAVRVPPLLSRAWLDGVSYGAQLEGGLSLAGDRPRDGLNVGQLTTDHADELQLNQVLLTVRRATDPKATGYDWGFALQAMYGSDVRFYHYAGELDHAVHDRYQLGFIQANVSAHLPWLTAGGIDARAGQFPTPLGFETIDPATSPFYSHSYIFAYGLPFLNTGVLATAHLGATLDLWGGVVSGNQTTLFADTGDDNGVPSGVFGLGLNDLLGGRLTVLALSQVGAENPARTFPHANGSLRHYDDVVVTLRAGDRLTLTTEGNHVRDDLLHAGAYGVAQYAALRLGGAVTLNARAEVWHDDGAFLAVYPGNLDAIDALEGRPSTAVFPGRATYGELTVGVTWRPTLPAPASLFMLRPELRWDHTLDGARPYDGGRKRGSLTAAVDAILGF